MKTSNWLNYAVFFCGLVLAAPSGLAQGSLTPPGAPAPTMRSLSQIEPRVPINSSTNLTASGSYYLTGNLLDAGSEEIAILASDVTLDLNGFTIIHGQEGIYVTNGLHNVVIQNGIIDGAASYGVLAQSSVTLDNLSVYNCGFGTGAYAPSNSVVRNCTFVNNGLNGLQMGDNGAALNVACISNANSGIAMGNGANVQKCVANGNNSVGISVGNGCVISECVAQGNSSHNISAGADLVISHTTANNSVNGSGIVSSFAGTVTACTVDNNKLYGIDAQQRGNILDCNARGNGQSGIHVNYAGNVQRCFCDGNSFCGIISDAGGAVAIINNNCTGNGTSGTNAGAGIRVTADGNFIDGNSVIVNSYGLDVESSRNAIMHNTASFNTTNYNIVSGNAYGALVNVAGVGDVSGTANAATAVANWSY